ncbi:MAG: winged helix-turn-helix domain-containing protein, partial [Succinivibrio sp.]
VKPFELSELEARIRAVMRRSGQDSEIVGLTNGELTLDPLSHEVRFKNEAGADQTAALTAREYSLLEALLRRPGAVLSRQALEDRIYAYGEEVESNAVEFIIYNLRRKIGAKAIRNVRGVGWKVAKGA